MREKPLILLVDDEDVFLEIASTQLGANGFDTVRAHSFQEAIEKAESLQPDLVLSDVYMPPGPSGWELGLALRRNPKTRNIKFAFFTSLHDPWMDLTVEKRREAADNLPRVKIFSKTGDVDSLAEEVRKLACQN